MKPGDRIDHAVADALDILGDIEAGNVEGLDGVREQLGAIMLARSDQRMRAAQRARRRTRRGLARRLESLYMEEGAPAYASDALGIRRGFCARPADDFLHAAEALAHTTATLAARAIDTEAPDLCAAQVRHARRLAALVTDLLRAAAHALDAPAKGGAP